MTVEQGYLLFETVRNVDSTKILSQQSSNYLVLSVCLLRGSCKCSFPTNLVGTSGTFFCVTSPNTAVFETHARAFQTGATFMLSATRQQCVFFSVNCLERVHLHEHSSTV